MDTWRSPSPMVAVPEHLSLFDLCVVITEDGAESTRACAASGDLGGLLSMTYRPARGESLYLALTAADVVMDVGDAKQCSSVRVPQSAAVVHTCSFSIDADLVRAVYRAAGVAVEVSEPI
ncbi:MAG: hypothetical protein KDB40_14000 [Acidimicrobiales bacterium]|nr:hypothetical protein [Acidimicrobiales bacterium]MCB9392444.1 hypothetical protein [Acidimicrobiaceae bacterium]